jgi:hypothetical protein
VTGGWGGNSHTSKRFLNAELQTAFRVLGHKVLPTSGESLSLKHLLGLQRGDHRVGLSLLIVAAQSVNLPVTGKLNPRGLGIVSKPPRFIRCGTDLI